MKWISVNDKLPKIGEVVLAAWHEEEKQINMCIAVDSITETAKGKTAKWTDDCPVTHWMRIPKLEI